MNMPMYYKKYVYLPSILSRQTSILAIPNAGSVSASNLSTVNSQQWIPLLKPTLPNATLYSQPSPVTLALSSVYCRPGPDKMGSKVNQATVRENTIR